MDTDPQPQNYVSPISEIPIDEDLNPISNSQLVYLILTVNI
jgi:hypothetical protein